MLERTLHQQSLKYIPLYNILGDSGGMLPREILKFSFSKMHIFHILRENEKMNRNLR